MIRAGLFIVLATFAAVPATAKEPLLGLPLDCVLGQSCYIQHYVDRDANAGVSDYSCGPLSYDGHKGTDFALPSLAAMQTGVDVVASAAGLVLAIRNDMPDIKVGAPGAPDITNKECGNGIVVEHSDGWETQYCHLKQGSIIVKPGQQITQGATLGKVGLSGNTQFPHVHFALRKNDQVMDPFDADAALTCNDPNLHSLWKTDMAYVGAGIINIGFSTGIPKYVDVKAGSAHTAMIPPDAPALVLWGYAYGGEKGDDLELAINGPNGEVIRNKTTIEKHQAQFFRAAGKRTKEAGWPTGTYTGTATLLRNGVALAHRDISIDIQ